MTAHHVPSRMQEPETYPEVRKFLRHVETVARVGAEAEEPEGVWASLVVLRKELQITTEMLDRPARAGVA